MTISEFLTKAENEGGLYEAVTSYGLKAEHLDRDEDPEFYDAISEYVDAAFKFHRVYEYGILVLSQKYEDEY